MRPIFEEPTRSERPLGVGLQQPLIKCTEARIGRKIVGPRQHVDAVDLVETKPADGTSQMVNPDDGRHGLTKALHGKGNASGKRGREALCHYDFYQRGCLRPARTTSLHPSSCAPTESGCERVVRLAQIAGLQFLPFKASISPHEDRIGIRTGNPTVSMVQLSNSKRILTQK